MPHSSRNPLLLLFVLAPLICAHAQYELPDEIFQRTLLVRAGNELATAFKFDQDGRIYLVTTRHFAKNLPLHDAVIETWHNQTWNDTRTVRTLFPISKEIDLAVLETNERMAKPYTVVKSPEVLTTGQKVWFMGSFPPIRHPQLPANMPRTSRRIFPEIPMVKIGTISAITPTQPDSFEIQFQGYYSLLTAAGPIIYWSPIHRDFEILGVIKRDERAATKIDEQSGHESVKSGIPPRIKYREVVDTIANHSPSSQ